MSLKWTGNQSDSGILRKNDVKEKKEELFVFGYSCKLFRDDEKAQHIDQGKHLIPWMGDESLKIDRYDARGALHSLSALEAPPGGYDWRVELTRSELDVEQLCDEERYRALHTDEIEEEMYKEEELKRLHAAGYGQVGFTYESASEATTNATVEPDEPFVPDEYLKGILPPETLLPDTEKLNAIIDKTAKFIASQGAQMEILLRAKQADNPQFQFLNKDSPLHPYYMALIGLVKEGKWPEKPKETVEHVEEKPLEHEDYLHPSLGSTVIEAAPSIPSLQYRPSSDCDYRLLVSRMRGRAGRGEGAEDGEGEGVEAEEGEVPPGADVPPPGTAPLPPRDELANMSQPPPWLPSYPGPTSVHYPVHYSRPPQRAAPLPPPPPPPPVVMATQQVNDSAPVVAKSTGLSLMKNYASDSDSDSDSSSLSSTDSATRQPIKTPPDDVIIVIDKMASYVARNGDDFAEIVRAKNDPRFTFLEPSHEYHPYYMKLMREKRGISNGEKSRNKAPVSFSIKKLKEPDPVLPKPALPYESSTDEEGEQNDNKSETETQTKEPQPSVQNNVHQKITTLKEKALKVQQSINTNDIIKINAKENVTKQMQANIVKNTTMAAPVLYKCEAQPQLVQNITATLAQKAELPPKINQPDEPPTKVTESIKEKSSKSRSQTPDRRKEIEKDYRKEKRRKESRRERKDEKSPRKKERKDKKSREGSESVVISIEEGDDVMIDLTGDLSDTKELDGPEKSKQIERRRRAAEFLKKVGVEPAALPSTSLGSAMVDTLKKKAEEEEKRRRREKKRHRHEYESSHKRSKRRRRDDDDSDQDKKKHKRKDKKRPKSRRRHSSSPVEEDFSRELELDLPSTLRGLRQASPTDIEIPPDVTNTISKPDSGSSDDDQSVNSRCRRNKKRERENRDYSEGEWSSDSIDDSESSGKNSR